MTRAALAEVVAREAALASDSVVDDLQAFSACQCRWLLRLSDDDLRRCPEFLLEDACTIPCELNRMKPDTLRRSKPSPDLLKLCARCLGATDTLVKSAHNREKLGKALYDLFLPVNAKGKTYTELAMYRQPLQENPGNVELLANASPEIAAKLCPAILWLFGDAEHIGDIYQIADQRLRIAALIKHLWDAPVHRAAFRTIVADVRAFVTFANGACPRRRRRGAFDVSPSEHGRRSTRRAAICRRRDAPVAATSSARGRLTESRPQASSTRRTSSWPARSSDSRKLGTIK